MQRLPVRGHEIGRSELMTVITADHGYSRIRRVWDVNFGFLTRADVFPTRIYYDISERARLIAELGNATALVVNSDGGLASSRDRAHDRII